MAAENVMDTNTWVRNEIMDLLFTYCNERRGFNQLIEWINTSDFFKAPASAKYHDNKEGGLAYHSLMTTYHLALEVAQYNGIYDKDPKKCLAMLKDMNPTVSSRVVVLGICHDFCKEDKFKKAMISKKADDGSWYKEPGYEYRQDCFRMGHGAKSVWILLNMGFALYDDEAQAIHYHMGAYGEYYGATLDPDLEYVFSNNHLAILLHIADLKASKLGG